MSITCANKTCDINEAILPSNDFDVSIKTQMHFQFEDREKWLIPLS